MEQLRKWFWQFPIEENYEEWNLAFKEVELDCNAVLYTVYDRGTFHHLITSDMGAIMLFNDGFECYDEDEIDDINVEMIECNSYEECAIALAKMYQE